MCDTNGKFESMAINDMKTEILQAVQAQRIIIIKGATGCGKTTRIPRLIYESDKEKINIVVTQPRRIAAMSIAKRVAAEMNVRLGTLVGYQIGLEKNGCDDTRILYVTTGVLLQKLIKRKQMNEFTHYIIDEIHEREQDMDFVLIVVRKFLNTSSKEARLILMSATMDTKKFQKYLVTYYNNKEFEPRVLDVGERTPYPIFEWFLEDLCYKKPRIFHASKILPFFPDSPDISENIYETAVRIIQELDKVDSTPVDENMTFSGKPAVLMFLPGINEIETMEKKLREISVSEDRKTLWIKPLHSSITTDEQQEVFKSPPQPWMRKIILSTNIAESSVTVTDIKYVIDFCLTKCLNIDRNTGCSNLELTWASRNSLKQRAGRVGRTCDGQVYRLISREFYERDLGQEAVPEILRCPLESLVLKAKLIDLCPPKKLLAEAMDPPDLGNIHQAVANLKEIGALLLHRDENYDPSDGDITLMGKVLGHLPLDVRLSKLIFLGNVLGVAEECIIMACAMATKNLFSSPYGKVLEAYDLKLWWARSTCSDCFAFLNAYTEWRKNTTEGNLNSKREREWAKANFLQLNALRDLAVMELDIKRRLIHHNLFSFEREEPVPRHKNGDISYLNDKNERPFFIKLAIAAAFYPNYFVRGCEGTRSEEKHAINTLGGHDPFSSVYFLGLPSNQPTVIYKNAVKKLFHRITDRLDVNMDHGTKAYVTFRRPLSERQKGIIPGKIEMGVYRAIKMRRAGLKFTIPQLRADEATSIYQRYLKQNEYVEDAELRHKISKLTWPWRRDDLEFISAVLDVRISHIESPQRFWIQSATKISSAMLTEITKILNFDGSLVDLSKNDDLAIGSVYVTAYVNQGVNEGFHRCRIMSKPQKEFKCSGEYKYTVYFIDFGNSCDVYRDQIYDIHPEVKKDFFIDKLPDFAVECSLVKVQPIRNKLINEPSQSEWSDVASSILKSIEYIPTLAKVYSVVNGVLRVKIVHPDKLNIPYKFENTINYDFIRRGFAEKVDEDYLSFSSREELERIRQCNRKTSHKKREYPANITDKLNFYDIELPGTREMILKGPYSPLEMKLSSMTYATASKQINIEKSSVNTILLNTNPSDPKDRMLVAAFVGVNPSGTRLNLMHTTLMPNLPALPMLCCLLFSPMVELRCNPTFTRYTGAMCGLGYDRFTNKSLYPANDVEVVFDHEISENHIELINKTRYWLNMAVNPQNHDSEHLKEDLMRCTTHLKDYLRKLFLENNYELQEPYFTVHSYRWSVIDYNRLRDPCPVKGVTRYPTDDHKKVYRLIWGVWRTGNSEKEKEAMLNNLKMLTSFLEDRLSQASFECELCRVVLENPTAAKMHVKEPEHRQRSRRYLEKSDDAA